VSLNFQTLIGSKGNPVAADIVTWNSSSPLKSRRTVDKLTGDLTPIRMKKQMKETDLNAYNVAKAMSKDGDDARILDLIFDDPDACMTGVLARVEWIALQTLSQGYVALTKSNNNGIITAENIDFQMPATHKRVIKSATATRIWSNATAGNPKPLTDISVISALAKSEGIKLAYALMTESKWDEMKVTTEVIQASLRSTTTGASPTLEEVNAYLKAQRLPEIILMDSYVDIENADHTISTVNCWTDKYVTFVPFMQVGNILSGPIAAETNPPKQSVQIKSNGVLIQKYSETDPVAEFTVGLVNAFPSWPTVDRCYRFDTIGVPQADGLDN
jgi:hypothetical protein